MDVAKAWYELTDDEVREILVAKGENPDLEPSGVSSGWCAPHLRHWVCEVDGHVDPDNSGLCIHCAKELDW